MTQEERAAYLAKVFMDATDAIVIENLDGEVIDANRAAEQAYGWNHDELIGERITKIVPESRHADADELRRRCVAGELVKDVETERVTRAGDSVWVLLTLSLLTDREGEAAAIATYAKDISRLKSEAAARERMATVFMDATDAIIIESLEGVVLDVNKAAEDAYGWARDELIGEPIKKIIPEFRHESADTLLRRCVAGEDVRNAEVVRVGRSGEERIVLLTLSRLHDGEGKPVSVASYAKDITELKSEAAARERMATVFMDATDAIIIESLEGVVLDVNKAAEDAYGWARDELIGEPIKKIIPEFRHESADTLLRRCVAGEDVRNVEVVRVGRSGEERIVLLTLSRLRDGEGKPVSVASYAKDITELRELEETQRQERELVIAAQADSMEQMSTPVTEIWEGVLLLPIVGLVDSRRARDMMDAVLRSIAGKQTRQLILDISGVGVVDTAVANHFIKISKAAQLMGCHCSISGVSPEIAQTMVDLGIDVGSITTTATMREALAGALTEIGISLS